MCIMYFYIFCSQTAVSWKLWFTREAAFTQWHVAGRDVLWWMVPLKIMELLLEAWQFWGRVSFISFQFWMYEVPASALPKPHAWLSLGVYVGWSWDAITQVFLVVWIPVMSQRYGRRNFVLFATEIQRGSFPCGGMAIGKHCDCKSFCLTLCFFSWLCVRLASRTYGEVLLFSF